MLLPKYNKVLIDPTHAQSLTATAHRAADAASEATMRHFRQPIDIENKLQHGQFDPVTVADKAAEAAIKHVVLSEYPDHGFYGEESEQVLNFHAPLWIVDPIDGTRSFITGMPLWGTLISVYDGDYAVIGLLDQPYLQERFVGMKTDQGNAAPSAALWRAELITPGGVKPLVSRSCSTLDQAIVQTTAPEFFTGTENEAMFEELYANVKMVRYGGDCYCYVLLALGFVDIVIETGLKPYDIAALIPIVRGAGGTITNWQGDSAVGGGTVLACGDEKLHGELLEFIARSGATG